MLSQPDSPNHARQRVPVRLVALLAITLTACNPATFTPITRAPATSSALETEMNPALITAAAQGDITQINQLLQQGFDINDQDAQGRTALMAATHANQVESVRTLLAAGADVNQRDKMLDNPFLYAGAEGLLEILKLTNEAGADPTITNRFGGTALIPAAERGHVEVVRYLLTHSAVDVNHINKLGWTALLEAIILGNGASAHQQIVALLIEHGADVNLADGEGVAPLRHAKTRGQAAVVALLEKAGAHE